MEGKDLAERHVEGAEGAGIIDAHGNVVNGATDLTGIITWARRKPIPLIDFGMLLGAACAIDGGAGQKGVGWNARSTRATLWKRHMFSGSQLDAFSFS